MILDITGDDRGDLLLLTHDRLLLYPQDAGGQKPEVEKTKRIEDGGSRME